MTLMPRFSKSSSNAASDDLRSSSGDAAVQDLDDASPRCDVVYMLGDIDARQERGAEDERSCVVLTRWSRCRRWRDDLSRASSTGSVSPRTREMRTCLRSSYCGPRISLDSSLDRRSRRVETRHLVFFISPARPPAQRRHDCVCLLAAAGSRTPPRPAMTPNRPRQCLASRGAVRRLEQAFWRDAPTLRHVPRGVSRASR
jgi:hypothetical protein